MNYKKLVRVMNIWMFVSMVLILSLLVLGQKFVANQKIIDEQNHSILAYKIKMSKMQKNLGNFDLYKFKEDVLTRKYPRFSAVSDVVYQKSKELNIDPLLVLSIIEIESAFNPLAVSGKGAYGLMQINYKVWKKELDIDFDRIFDMAYNVELGIRIFKQYLYHTKGNILQALHLYNNGFAYNNTAYKYKVISTDFLKEENLEKGRTIL